MSSILRFRLVSLFYYTAFFRRKEDDGAFPAAFERGTEDAAVTKAVFLLGRLCSIAVEAPLSLQLDNNSKGTSHARGEMQAMSVGLLGCRICAGRPCRFCLPPSPF